MTAHRPAPEPEYQPIYDVMWHIFNRHPDRATVGPAWLAAEAMNEIVVPRDNLLAYEAALWGLRLVAEAIWREYLGLPKLDAEPPLSDDPAELRRQGEALQEHADALQAHMRQKGQANAPR